MLFYLDITIKVEIFPFNSQVDFPEEASLFSKEENKQMVAIFDDETLKRLEEPQAQELEKEFNKFYIITYEIDESFAISTIKLFMPNPADHRAYPVDDLSDYIGTSPVSFEENDCEVLVEDGFDAPETPIAAEYDIVPMEDLFEDDKKG